MNISYCELREKEVIMIPFDFTNNSWQVVRKVIYHFNDSLEAKLFSNELNVKIYDTLSKVVRENVGSLQRYYKVRQKILGLDELYTYDLGTKLSNSTKEYSIEEAQQIVREALKPLGEDYLAKYDKIIKNRYIDYCQYKGKCQCSSDDSCRRFNDRSGCS